MIDLNINSLSQLIKEFPTEKSCRLYHEQKRWKYGVCCPHCGSAKIYKLKPSTKGNNYKCADKHCFMRFNVLTGTIFENTKISMLDWFKAIYLITSHKKGISSYQLGRDIGITQKSAWFILHRIRETMKDKAPQLLNNVVEIDETFVGGKIPNMHKHKRKQFEGKDNKQPVLGMLERQGKIKVVPIDSTSNENLDKNINTSVHPDATIYTDSFNGYKHLKENFAHHDSTNHSAGEFVKGQVHTNSIEGFFSIMKRGIYGIYHHTSKKHLDSYCNEFAFRYNTRKGTQTERFALAMVQAEGRLRYKDLIAKGGQNE